MASVAVSFTPSAGAPVYSFQFRNFGDNNIPRTYLDVAALNPSANGASVLSGPAYEQKRLWVVSSIINTSEAADFDAVYRAWDADRAQGKPVACGLVDDTFGATVTTSAVFSTAPTYTRMGPNYTMVSFGMTEV